MEYSERNRIFFILPYDVFQSDQKSQVTGLKLGFENKTPINLKPDWVLMVCPFPECNSESKGQLDITIIELSLSAIKMLSPPNFKPLLANSTIVGLKKEIKINNILDAFQAKFLKCEKQELKQELNINREFKQLQLSICSVDYNKSGTGSFIKMEFPESSGTWRYLIITAFHVAPITQSSEVTRLKLVFEDKTIGNVNLTPDWVKTLWTWPPDMNNDLQPVPQSFLILNSYLKSCECPTIKIGKYLRK